MAPFRLIETSSGNHSLLLTEFSPASETFEASGIEAGGYAWEAVARHIMNAVAPELAGRFGLDPESSMFCAYGSDREALTLLGGYLARIFHDPAQISALITELGADHFDD